MSTHDQFQPTDATPTVDPNVRVPDHVRQQAEAAEAAYKAAYAQPEPAAPVEQQVEQQPSAAEIAARAGDAPSSVAPAAPAAHPDDGFTAPADPQSLKDSEWARRYNSMKGRYDALVRQQGGMEETMRQLAAELARTQNMLSEVQAGAPQSQSRDVGVRDNHGNLITEQDRENYGDELIDLAARTARAAVGPELEQLRADNNRLQKQVLTTSKKDLFASLDRAVPDWRNINRHPQFLAWLRLPNIYTNQVRHVMLKQAVDGADAPKAIALFRDFLAEAAATGQQVSSAQVEQQAPAAPRAPALDLETLAAPGRARPASGDSQVPSEKPIYTRAQISQFYDEKRRGHYAGRDAEVNAFERDLEAAQREGRIR